MIKDLFKTKKNLLSFEVFPPKKEDDFEGAFETLDQLALLNPDFISVTYGAGGSKSKKTVEIASYIQNTLHIDAIAHLTCVGSKRDDITDVLNALKKENINQILALRGDRPNYMSDEQYESRAFSYASDLIPFIKETNHFHVAGACYPEKHFEAHSFEQDIEHLKRKVDAGAEFLITQLFFDNTYFYRFLDACIKHNIQTPICAGIMPITSAKQLGTTVSLSGSSVPKALADIIATYGENAQDMRKAGIDFAISQIRDLKSQNVDGIHIYTMNKPKMAKEIVTAI